MEKEEQDKVIKRKNGRENQFDGGRRGRGKLRMIKKLSHLYIYLINCFFL